MTDDNDGKSGTESEWDRQQGVSQSRQGGDDLQQDQREHQDRGQSEVEKDQS